MNMSTQAQQLEAIEKRFDELKTENNKIKGTLVLSVLKPFLENINHIDFEDIFSAFVNEMNLKQPDKFISLQQLKYIHLGIQDQLNKIKFHCPIGNFFFQSHLVLKKNKVVQTIVHSKIKEPIFQIFQKQLTQIIPYQVVFFDSLYKRDEKPSNKTPQKLNEQSLEQPYICYDYRIYENLLQNFQGPQMNKFVRFFYMTIDFRWVDALHLLKQQIVKDQKLNEAIYLLPTFQNLKCIQQQVNKRPQSLKKLLERRSSYAYHTQNLTSQDSRKLNEIRNILDFVCSYCLNISSQFKNPYLKAVSYFLGKKNEQGCKFPQICNNEKLGVMIKYLFARRFLQPNSFQQYLLNLMNEAKQNPKLEHIMFLKSKNEVVQTLLNYWNQHPNELQKVALTCGVVIHKLGKGFNKQYPFLEQMVRLYEEMLRNIKQKQIHKQYMLKMMSVRSSKQPNWEELIVKPQFRLNCEPRNDDCVFLSMLEKFLYGGDQKWNKLKTKSSVANDLSKKHYQVQAKHCPYCYYPTPRCSICLQNIKIFTVKSYLNQQIKRKTDKQQRPYMKLNQPLDQTLIWCPSCAHGGHFGHLSVWFKENKNCPVALCQCKCQY